MTENFVFIGAGGTASHLLHPLIAYLDGRDFRIILYDADTVEEKNLKRQLFYPWEIGQPKVSALARRFMHMSISDKMEYVGEGNIDRAVQEGDTILICADNMRVRRLVNEKAKTLDNVVVINGGNELYTGSVQTFIRKDGKNVTPALDFFSPEFNAANDDVDMSTMSCAEIAELPGGEQTVVANNSVAALMLQALVRYENDTYAHDEQWTKVTFDVEAGTFQTSDVRLIGGLNE